MKPYGSIIKHYEDCLLRHGDSHLGVDWPNEADAALRYRIMLDVIRSNDQSITLLDFGCGLSHLYDFISDQNIDNINYSGLEVSRLFYEHSKEKYPDIEYFCFDVLEQPEALRSYDYVVMNGVFTEKRELDFNSMWGYFSELIKLVFDRTAIGIAFNVMSKSVDWEREDLFHVPIEMMSDFLCSDVSRNFVVRNDYGLYEYTIYLYKEAVCG